MFLQLFSGRRANFMPDPKDNLHRPESRIVSEHDLVTPGLTPEQLAALGMRSNNPLPSGTGLPGGGDEDPSYQLWNPSVMGMDGHMLDNEITVLSGMLGYYLSPFPKEPKVTSNNLEA